MSSRNNLGEKRVNLRKKPIHFNNCFRKVRNFIVKSKVKHNPFKRIKDKLSIPSLFSFHFFGSDEEDFIQEENIVKAKDMIDANKKIEKEMEDLEKEKEGADGK